MTTELFLGGLTILTLAAIIILALTTGRRELHPDEDRTGREKQQPETQRSNYRSDSVSYTHLTLPTTPYV